MEDLAIDKHLFSGLALCAAYMAVENDWLKAQTHTSFVDDEISRLAVIVSIQSLSVMDRALMFALACETWNKDNVGAS